jgi:hypothetical protein
MSERIVLSLCDRTGNMVQPWIEAGYRAVTVDLQDAAVSNQARDHFVADLREWRYPLRYGKPCIVFAFPPCTDLAVSGARWFTDKGLASLVHALAIVNACRDICEGSGAPWMLENPVSTISSYWRKPDYSFHPHDFTAFEPGDNYTKKTCIWSGGGFIMPRAARARLNAAPDDRIHKAPPGPARGDFRSATPMGFARAVFESNALKQHGTYRWSSR